MAGATTGGTCQTAYRSGSLSRKHLRESNGMIPDRGMRYPNSARRLLSPSAAQQNVLRGVDLGREVGRAPLVGVKFLHQRPVRLSDGLRARARRQAKDLIGLLLRHFAVPRTALPRCRVTLRVFTPAGIPAVKISGQ